MRLNKSEVNKHVPKSVWGPHAAGTRILKPQALQGGGAKEKAKTNESNDANWFTLL